MNQVNVIATDVTPSGTSSNNSLPTRMSRTTHLDRSPEMIIRAKPAGISRFPAQPSHGDSTGRLFLLVDAAAQRLQTADPVAAAKYTAAGVIDDPQREQEVINGVMSAAVTKKVDAEYVRVIFDNQMDATKAIEYTRFADWKLNPASAPTTAPDLSALRATIDRLDAIIVEEIAAQWDLLNTSSCSMNLDKARTAVIAARQLDDLYQRALIYATHSYCQAQQGI